MQLVRANTSLILLKSKIRNKMKRSKMVLADPAILLQVVTGVATT